MPWPKKIVLVLAMLFIFVNIAEAKPKVDADLINGLGVYTPRGTMGPIADRLRAEGFQVRLMNHFVGATLTKMTPFVSCHSRGCNVAYKRNARVKQKAVTIVSIDPGRAPQYHTCTKPTRCINLYNPNHPIGGQRVDGATNIVLKGYAHVAMPQDPRVQAIVLREALAVRTATAPLPYRLKR